jgi:hypothetical protein
MKYLNLFTGAVSAASLFSASGGELCEVDVLNNNGRLMGFQLEWSREMI